jgi:hypothetical protein
MLINLDGMAFFNLETARQIVRKLVGSELEGTDDFTVLLVWVSSAVIGRDVFALSDFTKLPTETVWECAAVLRGAYLWPMEKNK